MQERKPTRKQRADQGTKRVIKDKFLEQRVEEVKVKPLIPMNEKQREYLEMLNTKSVCIATGFAGTSKTYLPTCLAADSYKLGKVDKIYVTRPAISSSKSMGYFKGSAEEKMGVWLNAVIPIFKDRLGSAAFTLALESEDITYIPLEVIKGMSISNAWLLVEEASDLTKDEVIKLVTRMGKNSKLVLSGDLRQSELKGDSGLAWLSKFVQRHGLTSNFGFIDFNDVNHIVRSDAVKQFIVALTRDERKGIE
jgi:phosphate starvation-inducible PhoH-like protein